MTVSFQNGDNFIRNMVTIPIGAARWSGPDVQLAVLETGELPVDVEEIMEDLRVDDPDSDRETVTRLAKGAAAFIARRTGYVLLPTRYELSVGSWWTGPLTIDLGPLREWEEIAFMAERDVWTPLDGEDYWSTGRDRQIKLRMLDSFRAPALWQPADCVRMRFTAGFDSFDETGGDLPIPDGLRTVLLMVTGHYYQNREMLGLADAKTGVQAVELGATSLLGQYRQFW